MFRRPLHWPVFALFATAFASGVNAAAAALLIINGCEVSAAEFRWFMQLERAGVIQLAGSKYHRDFNTGFWTNRLGRITASEVLLDRTHDRVVREKIEQQLFKELALLDDVSHEAFIRELEIINRYRVAAKSQGRVIFGPVTFGELQYFQHRKATLQLRAREILATNRLAASEAELRTVYKANRRTLATTALASWQFVTVQIRPGMYATAGDLKFVTSRIAKKLEARDESEQIETALTEDARFEVRMQLLNGMTEERLAEKLSDDKSFARAKRLKPGQVKILKMDRDRGFVVKCMARTPTEIPPFEKARPQVQRLALQKSYDDLIERLVQKAEVKTDAAQLRSIPIE